MPGTRVPPKPLLLLLAAFLVPAAVTVWAARRAQVHEESAREARFDSAVQRAQDALQERFDSYEQLLRMCRAVMATRTKVNRDDWRALAEGLELGTHHPGLYAMGFIARVPGHELEAFEAHARADREPTFRVHPTGPQDEYYPVLFVEPAALNLGALGYDLASDATRRALAVQARDNGASGARAPLTIAPDPHGAPAFLALLPVYVTGSQPTTPSARQEHITGWIFVGFGIADVLANLPGQGQDLTLWLGDDPAPANPDGGPNAVLPALTTSRHVEFGSRWWDLHFQSLPGFDERPEGHEPAWVLAGGFLLSGLLAATIWSLADTRRRALDLADGMTTALRASEASARAVVESVADGILTLDHEGRIRSYSLAAERIFGHEAADLIGEPVEVLIPALHEPTPGSWQTLGWQASGFTVPIEAAVTAMQDGSDHGWVLVVRDVSDRLRAEQALRESEERHRSVVAALQEGILVHDAGGAIETSNESAERILGVPAEKLRGLSLRDPLWQAVRADGSPLPSDEHPALVSLRTGNPCADVVLGIERPDGAQRWLSLRAVPLFFPGHPQPHGVAVSFDDVTEQRAAAVALEAVNLQLRSILDAATEFAILSTDVQGIIRVFNSGAERLLGYAASEMIGLSTVERLHLPSEIDRRVEELARQSSQPVTRADALVGLARSGTPETRLWTLVRKDGSKVRSSLTITPVHDAEDRLVGFLRIATDVTEIEKTEAARSLQHAVTRVLAESQDAETALPAVLALIGTTLGWEFGVFWRVQAPSGLLHPIATWCALPGAFDALEQMTRTFILPPGSDLAGRAWQKDQPLWSPNLAEDPDFFRTVPAARVGLHSGFATPVGLNGEVAGVIELLGRRPEEPDQRVLELFAGLGSQLAQFLERATATRARQASDQRSRLVIESMLEALLVTDRYGVIEQVNAAAERVFGYTSWELVGQHVTTLLPPQAADHPEGFLRDAYSAALGKVTRWEARRKNGEIFPFELSLVAFQTAEGRHMLAGHVRDISEEYKAERLKKEFVSTVSHELRTPLTSIRGSLALLLSGAMGDLPDEAKDLLAIADRNTVRLIALINDILDLERLEAGRMEMHFGTVSIAELVARSLEAVRGLADQQGVVLAADPVDAIVRGDGDRLVQVVVNLVSNAVKFSPRGATVRVESRPEGELLEISVVDRGRGIPAQALGGLFQRFQQVEASDSRDKGGTGLGLAICKAIVEQHGGSIGAESEFGQGSRFWFRVPLDRPAGHMSDDALLTAMQAGSGEGLDVLLVDSDPALLGVMTRQLMQKGLGARAVQDAAAALAAVRERTPRLIVFDPAVPGGWELPQKLRALELEDLPLVVYASQDLDSEARRELGLRPGARVLIKSRGGEALADIVLEVVQQAAAVEAPEERA